MAARSRRRHRRGRRHRDGSLRPRDRPGRGAARLRHDGAAGPHRGRVAAPSPRRWRRCGRRRHPGRRRRSSRCATRVTAANRSSASVCRHDRPHWPGRDLQPAAGCTAPRTAAWLRPAAGVRPAPGYRRQPPGYGQPAAPQPMGPVTTQFARLDPGPEPEVRRSELPAHADRHGGDRGRLHRGGLVRRQPLVVVLATSTR